MQFTVGGNRINYPSEVATLTAEMLVVKMLFNSVISMKGAQFMTMDISNFYLMTPLHHAKFIQIKLSDIPNEVINKYKLREKVTKNGSIYIRAKRDMCGLPQAGLLANELFKNASKNMDTGKANWYLDFGITTQDPYSSHWLLMILASNTSAEHAQHLENAHKEHYKLTCDLTGKRYIGITLDWDYNKRHVHLSMPNYMQKALKHFQHKAGNLQHAPYQSAPIQYGAKKQYATQE
jgi:hypothetical protein